MSLAPERQEDRATFLLLELVQTGYQLPELVGQLFASAVESGMSVDEAVEDLGKSIVRFSNLVNSTDVWVGLLPGGGQEAQYEILTRAQMASLREQHSIKAPTVIGEMPNIVLSYKARIYIGDDVFFTDRAEFFMDEHGFQWVKFVPNNGPSMNRENMVRTDTEGFRFVREVNKIAQAQNPGQS